jgi:hypothetical protein
MKEFGMILKNMSGKEIFSFKISQLLIIKNLLRNSSKVYGIVDIG